MLPDRLEVFESTGGGEGAIGEFEGIEGDPAGVTGGVEVGEELGPLGIALADDGGFGAVVDAADGITAADMANVGAEAGEDFVQRPFIANDGGGVEIDAEPGAMDTAEGAVDRGETGKIGAEGEHHTVAVGEFAEFTERGFDLGNEGGIGWWIGGNGVGGRDGEGFGEDDQSGLLRGDFRGRRGSAFGFGKRAEIDADEGREQSDGGFEGAIQAVQQAIDIGTGAETFGAEIDAQADELLILCG